MSAYISAQAASLDIFPTPRNDTIKSQHLYEPLARSSREIRLMRLRLQTQDGLVQCELLPPEDLASAKGRYTAISYCAGDPTKTKPILVNGVCFNVFSNLAHALDVTRDFWAKTYPDTPDDCLLWADQICIDQCNLAERSHQVGFMRSIYASARQTLICLSTESSTPASTKSSSGDETENTAERRVDDAEASTLGVEWLTRLHEQVAPTDDYYDYYFQLGHHLRTQLRGRDGGRFADGWLAFYDTVFRSPWWLRSWVYQEFISSPAANLAFLYGRASVPWSRVSEVLPTLRKYYVYRRGLGGGAFYGEEEGGDGMNGAGVMRDAQVVDTAGAVDFFVQSKMRFDRAGPYDLMDLLAQSRHLRSTDGRDRIYAFLGLVRQDYGIVPDYSPGNTPERLMLDVARRVVLQDQRLDILSYACEARGDLSSGLPSWVPDWTSRKCHNLWPSTIKEEGEKLPNLRIRGGEKLEVQGYRIGTFQNGQRLVIDTNGIKVNVRSCQEDDEVWALVGSRNPFVMRRLRDGFVLVQEASFSSQVGLSTMGVVYGLPCQTVLLL